MCLLIQLCKPRLLLNMKYITLITFVCFLRCTESSTVHGITNCSDITLTQETYLPIVNSKSYFLEKFGAPIEKVDSCASKSLAFRQGKRYYSCLKFKQLNGIQVREISDTMFIYRVDFSVFSDSLKFDNLNLSRYTNLKEMVDHCTILNMNLNKHKDLAAILNGTDYLELDEITYKESRPRSNKVELLFDSIGLKLLIYNWEPAYSQMEWKNYIKVKNSLDQ